MMLEKLRRFTPWAFGFLGLTLLILNVVGMVQRHHGIRVRSYLSSLEIPVDSNREFAFLAVSKTDDALYHQYAEVFRPDPLDNWLLYILSFSGSESLERYEYASSQRAVARGIGWCSQASIVLVSALEKKDIAAHLVGLGGHVVTIAEINPDEWWVLDADYGTVIPIDFYKIESNPEIIRPYYENLDGCEGCISTPTETLIEIYGPEGNRMFETVGDYLGRWQMRVTELADIMMWIIPVLLITVAVNQIRRRARA